MIRASYELALERWLWVGKTEGEERVWYIRVAPWLDEALERIMRNLGYTTKSEFIRELVRRELERRGIELKAAGE